MEKTLIPSGIGMISCLVLFTMLALTPSTGSAQQKPTIAGDYAGTLGPLHIKLHLKENAAGKVTGTLDSPDRGAIGIQCADFNIDGRSISFSVPAVQGGWRGTLGSDGTLSGTWDQGYSVPLNFARNAPTQPDKALNASLR
ncbi:MAG: hypothetical protein ABSF70_00270 [Terracidiphilus sp.]